MYLSPVLGLNSEMLSLLQYSMKDEYYYLLLLLKDFILERQESINI